MVSMGWSEKKRKKYLISTEEIIFKLTGESEEEKKEQEDKEGGELNAYEEGCKIFENKAFCGSIVSDQFCCPGSRVLPSVALHLQESSIRTCLSQKSWGNLHIDIRYREENSEARLLSLNPDCSVDFVNLPILLSMWWRRGTRVCNFCGRITYYSSHRGNKPKREVVRSKNIILLGHRIPCFVFYAICIKIKYSEIPPLLVSVPYKIERISAW